MKVTLFMAISVNGYIADTHEDEDFLSHENWYTFSAFAKQHSNFIVGRSTYEAVQSWKEGYSFDDFSEATKIILSRDTNLENPEGYIVANSCENALAKLADEGFEQALVIGGSKTNQAFAQANLLDEIILNVEPVVLGAGIPLFNQDDFMLNMSLLGSKQITDDIIQLRYKVLK